MDAVQERLARWTAPDQTHPLAKREADLAAYNPSSASLQPTRLGSSTRLQH